MMGTTHTPGPYYIAERTRWNADVRFIRTHHDKSGVIGVTTDTDAPLFAAAPDLLAALKDALVVIRHHEGHTRYPELIEQIETAIAKATSERTPTS